MPMMTKAIIEKIALFGKVGIDLRNLEGADSVRYRGHTING